jgi:hypothetical protein
MPEDIETRQIDDRTFEIVSSWSAFCIAETTGGKEVVLVDGIDEPPAEVLTDEVLLALTEPRRQGLAALMASHRIVSGPDYQYDEDYELLYSTGPVGRYVVVTGDETYRWLDVVDTREDAAESVRGAIVDQAGNEYPHHPLEIRDLDTGQSVGFKYQVVVELGD